LERFAPPTKRDDPFNEDGSANAPVMVRHIANPFQDMPDDLDGFAMKQLLSLFGGGAPSKFVTEVTAITIHVGIDAAVSAVVRLVKDHHCLHRKLWGANI